MSVRYEKKIEGGLASEASRKKSLFIVFIQNSSNSIFNLEEVENRVKSNGNKIIV